MYRNLKRRGAFRALMRPAIAQLQISLGTVTNNEPINRKEGDIGQADLEHENAKSYRAAISALRKTS